MGYDRFAKHSNCEVERAKSSEGSEPRCDSYPSFFAAVVVAISNSAQADPSPVAAIISGIAEAHDGNDVRFGRVRVRLRGMAAPEDYRGHRLPGGPEATAHLGSMVNIQFVVRFLDGTTAGSADRAVGQCYESGLELNEAQVTAGFARDCPRFSGGAYAQAEDLARRQGRDLSAIYDLPSYCSEGD